MKKILLLSHVLALSFFFVSCSKDAADLTSTSKEKNSAILNKPNTTTSREGGAPPTTVQCVPTKVTMIAGQTIDAGNITVTNDANFITVTYNAENGYVLTQTHLFVGECALIPVNGPGNPIPGKFPYSTTHDNVTSYTYQIPTLAIPMGTCGCIAAHAVVVKYDETGQIIDQQTAWGNGTRINTKGNWGMKFSYCSCVQ